MKFIVFTTDIPPVAGVPTSGTALRTFGIVQGLRSLGHQVQVSVPKSALEGFRRAASQNESLRPALKEFELTAFDSRNQADLIENSGADAVLCGHWPALATSFKPSIPVIIDLAGPHLLERHYQGSENQQGAILGKLHVVSRADYFIVSGAKQRLYFLSYLLRAKVPGAEKRICTIPMPLPPQTPEKRFNHSQSYPKFVFGGVFLPWQDPSFALREVVKELDRRRQGKLTCIGGQHPNYPINEGVYKKLFEELSKNSRVEIQPMAPYEQFIELLGEQDVAVDLMKWNLERELAVTIRSTTYLWAGLPVIYNSYADLGALIARYDAGWLVPPGDSAALGNVFAEIFADPLALKRKSEAAQTLARECFSWDRAVQSLLALLGTRPNEISSEVDIILDFPQNAELRLLSTTPVEQTFTCRVDGLRKVEFRVATHGVSSPLAFRAELFAQTADSNSRDSATRQSIAQRNFGSAEISNNDWHTLEFEPIVHSAGKEFVLELSSNGSDASLAISPWACNDSPYPLTALRHGNTTLRGRALCVRTTCQLG